MGDYRDRCIESNITELPSLVSWCKTGFFRPEVVRIGIEIASRAYGYDQFFQTQSGDQYQNTDGGDEWFAVEDLIYGEFRVSASIKSDITSPEIHAEKLFLSTPVISTYIPAPAIAKQWLFTVSPNIQSDISSDLVAQGTGQLVLRDTDDVGNGSINDGVEFDQETGILYVTDIGYTGSGYQTGSYSVNENTGELTRIEDAQNLYAGAKATLIKDSVNGDILVVGANSYTDTYRAVNGNLTNLHHLTQTGSYAWDITHHVYPNGDEFIFVVSGLGLRVYTVNHVTGQLTIKGTHKHNTREYRGVWADDSWVYCSAHDEGLKVYEITPTTGVPVFKSSYDGGANTTQGLWSNGIPGSYLFQANSGTGIRTYTVDPITAEISYKGNRAYGYNTSYIYGDEYGFVYACGQGYVSVFTVGTNGLLVYGMTLTIYGTTYDIKTGGKYIYVAHRDRGTAVLENI